MDSCAKRATFATTKITEWYPVRICAQHSFGQLSDRQHDISKPLIQAAPLFAIHEENFLASKKAGIDLTSARDVYYQPAEELPTC
eukprot:3597205-Amphidinium_carterae.1